MPLTYLTGDPLQTTAETLAIGHNAKGRIELGTLETALMQRHPMAFTTYQRRARQDKHPVGTFWIYEESQPRLMFLTIRETSVGMTRLRYVQSVLMSLIRDAHWHRLTSLAIAPLGREAEQSDLLPLYEMWLKTSPLPISIYTLAMK